MIIYSSRRKILVTHVCVSSFRMSYLVFHVILELSVIFAARAHCFGGHLGNSSSVRDADIQVRKSLNFGAAICLSDSRYLNGDSSYRHRSLWYD
jgi:hypothetical protein